MKMMALCTACAAALLCGCGSYECRSEADEITSAAWSVSEGDVSASLTFSGDCASLRIDSGSEHDELEGLCVIGDGVLIILDESDKFEFSYRLTGNTLTLGCGKDSVTLAKEK